MPQMMPMLWMAMLSYTMMILLIITIFMHFFNLPAIKSSTYFKKSPKLTNWIWLW